MVSMGFFMKKCWNTIKLDFSRLFNQISMGELDIQSINGSHIVVIPKKDSPITVNDFSPISLLNSSLKLLTKLLANNCRMPFYQWCTQINMVL
jgi:hypothetical protein